MEYEAPDTLYALSPRRAKLSTLNRTLLIMRIPHPHPCSLLRVRIFWLCRRPSDTCEEQEADKHGRHPDTDNMTDDSAASPPTTEATEAPPKNLRTVNLSLGPQRWRVQYPRRTKRERPKNREIMRKSTTRHATVPPRRQLPRPRKPHPRPLRTETPPVGRQWGRA